MGSIQSNGCKEPENPDRGNLAEKLIANRGILHPWCRREVVDPRPFPGLNAIMPPTSTTLTPIAAATTTTTKTKTETVVEDMQ